MKLSLQVPPGQAAGEVRQREAVRLPVPQVGASGGAAARLLLRQLQHQRGALPFPLCHGSGRSPFIEEEEAQRLRLSGPVFVLEWARDW